MKNLVLLITLVLFGGVFVAQAQSANTNIYYKVTVPNAQAKIAKVEASFPLQNKMIVMYVHPYKELKDGQAAFVQNLKVTGENGKPIKYDNKGVGDWKLKTSNTNQTVKLSYEIRLEHDKYRWPIGKEEIAYRTSEGLFFIGQSLFIVPGYKTKSKVRVDFDLPETWNATTPWNNRQTSAKSKNSFEAANLHSALRNCIFLGTHQEEKVEVGSFDFTLVLGKKFQKSKALFINTMRPMINAYIEMFGSSQRSKYLVVINEDYRTDGGAYSNSYSMVINGAVNKASSVVWAHGMAHEMLHLWNGTTTIVPKGQEEWFKEGFTDYMTVVLMSRKQLISESILYKRIENIQRKYLLAKFMQGVKVSVRKSGDQKQRNRLMVYGGGALVGLCLDIEMRTANNNTKGVYELMRAMYEQFGKTGKRYTMDDIISISSKLAGKDLTPFFEKYVAGKAYLDVAPYLQKVGLQIHGFFEEVFVSKRADATTQEKAILKSIFGQ